MKLHRLGLDFSIVVFALAIALIGCGAAEDQLKGTSARFEGGKKFGHHKSIAKIFKKKKEKKHHHDDDDDCDDNDDGGGTAACGGVIWGDPALAEATSICLTYLTGNILSAAEQTSITNDMCAYGASGLTSTPPATIEQFCADIGALPPPPPPPPA